MPGPITCIKKNVEICLILHGTSSCDLWMNHFTCDFVPLSREPKATPNHFNHAPLSVYGEQCEHFDP